MLLMNSRVRTRVQPRNGHVHRFARTFVTHIARSSSRTGSIPISPLSRGVAKNARHFHGAMRACVRACVQLSHERHSLYSPIPAGGDKLRRDIKQKGGGKETIGGKRRVSIPAIERDERDSFDTGRSV